MRSARPSRARTPSRSPRRRAGSTPGSCSSTAGCGTATCSAAASCRTRSRTTCASNCTLLGPSRLLFLKKPERRSHGRRQVWFGTSKPGVERFFQLEVDHLEDLRDFDFAAALAGEGRRASRSTTRCSSSARTASAIVAARRTAGRSTTPFGARPSRAGSGSRPMSAATASPATSSSSRRGSTTAGSSRATRQACSRRTPPAGSTWTATAAVPPTRSRCRQPSRQSARPRGCSASTTSPSSAPGGRATTPGAYASAAPRRRQEVDVAAELADEPVYLTCGAAEPSRPRRYVGDGSCRSV